MGRGEDVKPYYEEDGITLYCGDCRILMPNLKFDVCITDPPYPKLRYSWEYVDISQLPLGCRSFFFWMNPPVPFPLAFTAAHIWSKANIYIGNMEQWEIIYEIDGNHVGSVLRESSINCKMNAIMNGDVFWAHPTQKPVKLMRRLIGMTKGTIIDPFCGSGTTLLAAKQLGRKAIGVEISEEYCAMAVRRLVQMELRFK